MRRASLTFNTVEVIEGWPLVRWPYKRGVALQEGWPLMGVALQEGDYCIKYH